LGTKVEVALDRFELRGIFAGQGCGERSSGLGVAETRTCADDLDAIGFNSQPGAQTAQEQSDFGPTCAPVQVCFVDFSDRPDC